MKKSADKLAIAYVIILSLIPVLALPNLIFQNHVLDAIPYDASVLTTELGFFCQICLLLFTLWRFIFLES